MREELIAPCGMNCGICSAFLAKTHDIKSRDVRMGYCAGCRPRGKQCAWIKKRCEYIGHLTYCYECPEFPCKTLQHLDTRYRTLFRMSMIENLNFIKENGLEKFLAKEQAKWQCPDCGGTICCHNGLCFNCSLETLQKKKQKYRWED